MSDVKRYDVTEKYIGTGEYVGAMEESATGDWVAFSDYDALKARLEALEELIEISNADNKRLRDDFDNRHWRALRAEARLTEVEAERATMISVVASARERADNAERECARLKAAWDAAYEQAMQNGAAANEAKARLAEAMFILEVCVPILIDSCKQHDKGAIQRWDEARGTRWPRADDSEDASHE